MPKVILFLVVVAVLGLTLSLVLRTPLGVFLALAIVAGIPLAYARFAGRRRHLRNGVSWRGYVSFPESELLANERLFHDIHRQKRSGRSGRSELSSGKCIIRDTGINWRSGGWATPQTEVFGTFSLPWSES